MAQRNDIILIAGKGHETYQEIKGERFDFDDYKIVRKLLKQLQKIEDVVLLIRIFRKTIPICLELVLFQFLTFRAALAIILSLLISTIFGKKNHQFFKDNK